MPQELHSPTASLISPEPIPAGAETFDGLEDIFEVFAAGLYSLASMLVGEGEDSARLVEAAIANAEVSVCQDPREAHRSSRQSLSAAALDLLTQRSPDNLAAPLGLAPATTCIEDDNLASVGISAKELESMIGGPERDRTRKWLASLPIAMRAVFVLRAVAGLTAAETAELLKSHGGPQAAAWTPEAAREVFRQGLCSLASQLLRNRE